MTSNSLLRSMALAKKLLKKWSLHIWENEEGRRKLQRFVKVKVQTQQVQLVQVNQAVVMDHLPPVSTTKRGKNMWRILTQVSTRTLHNICLGKCSALDFNSWWQLWRVELWVGRSVSLKFTVCTRIWEQNTFLKNFLVIHEKQTRLWLIHVPRIQCMTSFFLWQMLHLANCVLFANMVCKFSECFFFPACRRVGVL